MRRHRCSSVGFAAVAIALAGCSADPADAPAAAHVVVGQEFGTVREFEVG